MKKWLLIEDEPDLYEILTTLYNVFDAEAIAFSNGQDAMAWLATLKPDLVPIFALIDIRLPGEINGVDLAQALHQHALLQNLPIVLMTAYRLSFKQEQEVLEISQAKKLIYKPLPSFDELRRIFADLT